MRIAATRSAPTKGSRVLPARLKICTASKVPNLRNVELTAPYLHDGTVTTLDEAVRIMGVYLSGMDIPKGDRDLIVGFLRTLTGEWNGKPLAGEAVKN